MAAAERNRHQNEITQACPTERCDKLELSSSSRSKLLTDRAIHSSLLSHDRVRDTQRQCIRSAVFFISEFFGDDLALIGILHFVGHSQSQLGLSVSKQCVHRATVHGYMV